jgi:hypothetical protein
VISVPRYYDFATQFARAGLGAINCNNVTVADQVAHRRTLYAQTTRVSGIRAPHSRSGDQLFCGNLIKVGMAIALFPGVAAWMGRTGIAMSFTLRVPRSFLTTSSNNDPEIGNFALCRTLRPE